MSTQNFMSTGATGVTGYQFTANNRQLYAHSMHSATPIEQPVVGFRYSLEGGSALVCESGYNVIGNFLVNYGPTSADTMNYGSPDFNVTTGIYTVPRTGYWHLTAGALLTATVGATGPTGAPMIVAIGPPGNTSDPYFISSTHYQVNFASNFATICSGEIYLTAGTQLQAYIQQASGVNQTAAASRYNFFSGFLLGSTNTALSPL
jgi:hypothetical protein